MPAAAHGDAVGDRDRVELDRRAARRAHAFARVLRQIAQGEIARRDVRPRMHDRDQRSRDGRFVEPGRAQHRARGRAIRTFLDRVAAHRYAASCDALARSSAGQHGRGHGARAGLAAEIGRELAAFDDRIDGAFDRNRFGFEAERMAQQQRGAEDRAAGIGDALAGDVGRRAVDRLVQADASVAERSRRQQAQRAGQHRRLVGEDVAEHVLGDDRRRIRAARASRCIAIESTSWCSSVTSGNSSRRCASRPRATAARFPARWPCRPT